MVVGEGGGGLALAGAGGNNIPRTSATPPSCCAGTCSLLEVVTAVTNLTAGAESRRSLQNERVEDEREGPEETVQGVNKIVVSWTAVCRQYIRCFNLVGWEFLTQIFSIWIGKSFAFKNNIS